MVCVKTIDGLDDITVIQNDLDALEATAHQENADFDTGTGDITTTDLTVNNNLNILTSNSQIVLARRNNPNVKWNTNTASGFLANAVTNTVSFVRENLGAWQTVLQLPTDSSGSVISFRPTQVTGNLKLAGSTSQLLTQDGTQALPAITTEGNNDTGIYFEATDQVSISSAAQREFHVSPNLVTVERRLSVAGSVDLLQQEYYERKNNANQSIGNNGTVNVLYQTLRRNYGYSSDKVTYSAGVFTINKEGRYIVTFNTQIEMNNTVTAASSKVLHYLLFGTGRYGTERQVFTPAITVGEILELNSAVVMDFIVGDTFVIQAYQLTGATQRLNFTAAPDVPCRLHIARIA